MPAKKKATRKKAAPKSKTGKLIALLVAAGVAIGGGVMALRGGGDIEDAAQAAASEFQRGQAIGAQVGAVAEQVIPEEQRAQIEEKLGAAGEAVEVVSGLLDGLQGGESEPATD